MGIAKVCHCNVCADVLGVTNTTCVLRKGSKCYTSLELVDNEEELTYGCLPPDLGESRMQVRECCGYH